MTHPLIPLIATTPELETFCASLKGADFVALDTEFIREKTYYPRLCLVQLAGPKGAAAIDPLAEGIDLAPLFDVLADGALLKVLHAGRQDIEIFFHLTGRIPAPIFDTQIAAQVCGYGDAASYSSLVQSMVGLALDKGSRFTDWAKRPLSDKQIAYALADVVHLREVYVKLHERINGSGRHVWIEEELAFLADPANYTVNLDEVWKRLRPRNRSPRALAVLRELAKWREMEAQRLDVPRGRVLSDDALAEIAAAAPGSLEDLQRIRGLERRFGERQARTLLAAIAAAQSLPPSEHPRLPERKLLPEGSEDALDLLKLLLKIKSRESGVAASLIATTDDLEALVRGDAGSHLLHGWREEVFGRDALRALKGEMAIGFDGKDRRIQFRPC